MTPSPSAPLKVLFVGGHGRSGSTLLEQLVGQLPGFFSVGELRNVWRRGLAENQLCGCGDPFSVCPFWSAVFAQSADMPRAAECLRLKDAAERGRYVVKMMLPLRSQAYRSALECYAALVGRTLSSIRRVSRCDVVVDASKDPSHGFLLARVPGIELYTLQLVRDSRAVSYSWTRKKVRPEVHWKRETMNTYSPLQTGWHWTIRNLLVHALSHFSSSYMVMRYEDFVGHPRGALRRIAEFVGRDAGDMAFLQGSTAFIEPGHGVGGNPVRFQRGPVAIRADSEWRASMSVTQQRLVTAMTFPMLAYYGYLGSNHASSRAEATPQ